MQDLELKKAAIIAEYLTKQVSFRELGRKYGVHYPRIHAWVQEFQKHQGQLGKHIKTNKEPASPDSEELPEDLGQLREELRKARLENKLLNAIINIAEEQLNIDIRKKPGTKRLKK